MKGLSAISLPLVCAIVWCAPFSTRAMDSRDFLVHMGADLQARKIPLEKGFGDNLLKQKYVQTGAYAGMRFLEDKLGFECGYQRSLSRSQTTDVTGTSSYFGSNLPTGTYSATTKASMQNFYGSLLGLIPLSQRYPLKLILQGRVEPVCVLQPIQTPVQAPPCLLYSRPSNGSPKRGWVSNTC